ncbi:hypothetical protein [Alicyclobacillus sp. SP_1]|uniref:hypothetical protein n=1 Tax=Alicyclobacillus sp. SP_1 TaxID=2942475 RepID=UPI00215793E7|nr:hypothetical protein [Alicyclobacillus sp. SP_1]
MAHLTFSHFDIQTYHAINGLAGHHPLLDAVLMFFAKYALEIYVVLYLVAWFTLPKMDTRHRHALIVVGFAGMLALFVNVAISHIWFRPRPYVVLRKGT